MRRSLALIALGVFLPAFTNPAFGQSLGNAGTIEGTVLDPSGASVHNAAVTIHNALTDYKQSTTTAADGSFRLSNIPPNPYHLTVTAQGFDVYAHDVEIRGAVPVQLKIPLVVAGGNTTIEVEGTGAALLELDPSAHVDVDRNLIMKLPTLDPGGGLSQAITYSSGGVAADGNGSFHPLGDHAQVTFVIDGQPVSDQQSKVFSTQLPDSAIQSFEATTGTPAAEYGDKSSLIANITTRSGLGLKRVSGSLDANYGSFGTGGGSFGLGFGNDKIGNFLAVDATRSGRFLDTPEFVPYHDIGNNETIFDRLDLQPDQNDVLHFNLFTARNWIEIPNSLDQLAQDQRQRVETWSIAPGYQHTFNAHTLLTINPYVRRDQFHYYGSRNPFADSPATENQARQLLNWGVKADLAWTSGRHSVKAGVDIKQTRLAETFAFGITDDTYNAVCVNQLGNAAGPDSLVNPTGCANLGLLPNPSFTPSLLPYDLTRGGSLFTFHAARPINQYAAYGQDVITLGRVQIILGLRGEHYDGISSANGVEPRVGLAYNIKGSGTVLRGAYARTFETPFNENLLLSSATGVGGLDQNVFGSNAVAIKPGIRNQLNTGFQQSLGKFLLIDADYFWKYTNNAYDFSTLLNTTITFPISWHNSKLDGFTGRVSTTNLHGFQAYWTSGHTRARYFFPEVGGLIAQGTPLNGSVFRIDHDQAFQSTGVFRYQHGNAEWVAFTWRYDSGLVVSGVPDATAALALTPNQEVTLGLACNGVYATLANPLTACNGMVTSKLLTLPQAGQENDDHNPDRVKPRNVFNLGIGTDNLFHSEGHKRMTVSLDIANLMNKVALYNFLSTFSGTHFLQPRTVLARIGVVF